MGNIAGTVGMSGTRQVAVIIDAANPAQREIIRGVAAYARDAGNWSLYVEQVALYMPDLRTWPGTGVIADLEEPRVAAATRGVKIPLVQVGGVCASSSSPRISAHFETDDEAIARLAAEHLADRGFARLAYFGLPRSRQNPWSEIRARAFKKWAGQAGLPCAVYTGRYSTNRKWAELQRDLSAWLASLEKPVGLMACNDARALHVLEACRTIGARVPDDVAVIGVDNDEIMCQFSNPPLTSIEQGGRQIGYQAAAMLDRLMAGKRAPRSTIFVEPEGVLTRRSTDTLAIEDPMVAAAVRFIREHGCDGIRVEDVARAVRVSRWTLQPRFKAAMRRTVHAEIRRVQIERAEKLVSATDMPLKQIAVRTGFKHVQYMTTLFRRHLGETPAEYRRRRRV